MLTIDYNMKKNYYDVRHKNTHFMYPNPHFLDKKNDLVDTKNEQNYFSKIWIHFLSFGYKNEYMDTKNEYLDT